MPEPLGGAHTDVPEAARILKATLLKHLEDLKALSPDERRQLRYDKFRAMGVFGEEKSRPQPEQAS